MGGCRDTDRTRLTASPLGNDLLGVVSLFRMMGVSKGMGGSGHRPGTRPPKAIAVLFTSIRALF